MEGLIYLSILGGKTGAATQSSALPVFPSERESSQISILDASEVAREPGWEAVFCVMVSVGSGEEALFFGALFFGVLFFDID